MTTSDADEKRLGSRIRELRLARRMTQNDLAGSKYSVSYISAVERGRVTRPSRAILEWCAKQLQVGVPEITGQSVLGTSEGLWMQRKLSQHSYEQVYAQVLVDAGEIDRARALLRKLRHEGSAPRESALLWYSAVSAYLAGDTAEAAELVEACLRMASEQQDVHGATAAHWLLGRIALAQGDVGRANEELARALAEEAQTLVNPDASLLIRGALAEALRALSDPVRAHEMEADALREYELFANPIERARRARERAEKAANAGDYINAYQFIRWAWESHREVNAHREAAALYLRHATFASEDITSERRETELRRALDLADLVGDVDTGRLAAAYLAVVLAERGELSRAEEMMGHVEGAMPAKNGDPIAKELDVALTLARGWMAVAYEDKDEARRRAAELDVLLERRAEFAHTDARYAGLMLSRLYDWLEDQRQAFVALKRAMERRR